MVVVSLRELTWLIANNFTVAPTSAAAPARVVERFALSGLGEEERSNRIYRQVISTWLMVTGIQGGYGFFAPNISDSYHLIFDFEFNDGHHEFDVPRQNSREMAVRLAGALDEIGRTPIDILREQLVRLLMLEPNRAHSGAIRVTATLLSIAGDDGTAESSRMLYRYTFELPPH